MEKLEQLAKATTTLASLRAKQKSKEWLSQQEFELIDKLVVFKVEITKAILFDEIQDVLIEFGMAHDVKTDTKNSTATLSLSITKKTDLESYDTIVQKTIQG